MANRLQRKLLAQQNRQWDFNQEEGFLDTSKLARIIANPNNNVLLVLLFAIATLWNTGELALLAGPTRHSPCPSTLGTCNNVRPSIQVIPGHPGGSLCKFTTSVVFKAYVGVDMSYSMSILINMANNGASGNIRFFQPR